MMWFSSILGGNFLGDMIFLLLFSYYLRLNESVTGLFGVLSSTMCVYSIAYSISFAGFCFWLPADTNSVFVATYYTAQGMMSASLPYRLKNARAEEITSIVDESASGRQARRDLDRPRGMYLCVGEDPKNLIALHCIAA